MQKALQCNPNVVRKRRGSRNDLNFRHILVPLDFSGFARQALTCAVPLARQYRAQISLVHVVRSPAMSTWGGIPGGGHYLAMNLHNLIDAARERLMAMAAQLLPEESRGQVIVSEGNPAGEVVAAAKALKVDLMVLSNRGRSGLSRVLLGSTAERIVRLAHCPVFTVRRDRGASAVRGLTQDKPKYPKRSPWRRILVPLDFSLNSLRALTVAAPLARQTGAQLFLLNVVEPNPYPAGLEGVVLAMPDSEISRNARNELPRVARRFIPESIRASALAGRGRAANVIVNTAEEKAVDLIVLSTHGHGGFDGLLIGSTAEQVVRQAKCPVFVVRKPRDS